MSRASYSLEFINKMVELQELGKKIYMDGQDLLSGKSDREKLYVWLVTQANIHRALGDEQTCSLIARTMKMVEQELHQECTPTIPFEE